ncbi:META domain-containing protein [uncultured Allomuricauda sp.]|uniref:META domain-containing protein n=1 Tax=Flagellimonas sp. W118 TaxID=3410791 RepID=UPI0026135C9A|nr:META domain-containing protein [uncultured Allomuricauda sp.]
MEFVRRNYLNSFSGNNGCNQIMGNLKGLTNTDLQFATINETRMACKEMKLSSTFLTLLRETNQYKITKLNLTLMDSNGKVLLLFKKID